MGVLPTSGSKTEQTKLTFDLADHGGGMSSALLMDSCRPIVP